ncbi:MAG: glycoside hydrolase family 5 protein [Ferruginibacter sp.]
MKTRLILLFLLIISITTNAQSPLHLVGTQLSDTSGKPIVLRGMSFGWLCFHPRFYNADVVKWLHTDWNCNVVRAAMGVEPKNGYKENPKWNTRKMRTVINAAIKEKMYVIIDWHSHNINLPEAITFFTQMAKEYAGYPNIIYELFNEPDYETWPEVKAYAETLIALIRKYDTNNIIIVGSPHWDQYVMAPAQDPIKGYSNIMYSMHFYAGTHKQELRNRTDSAMAMGLPIFISESAGMEATGDGPIDEAEWHKYIQWADEKKLSLITWSVSDKDETCSVLLPSASSKGKWKDSDLKQSGREVREILRKGE